MVLSDNKLLQSIGNIAARHVESKYRAIEVRFFAFRGEARVHIADRHDRSEKTGRLYDLGPLPPPNEPIVIKDTIRAWERQIEMYVREFLRADEPQ